MTTVKNLYIMVSTIVFTFGYPVWGHTPANWALRAIHHLLKAIQ